MALRQCEQEGGDYFQRPAFAISYYARLSRQNLDWLPFISVNSSRRHGRVIGAPFVNQEAAFLFGSLTTASRFGTRPCMGDRMGRNYINILCVNNIVALNG
jgi:hypothetical protein